MFKHTVRERVKDANIERLRQHIAHLRHTNTYPVHRYQAALAAALDSADIALTAFEKGTVPRHKKLPWDWRKLLTSDERFALRQAGYE